LAVPDSPGEAGAAPVTKQYGYRLPVDVGEGIAVVAKREGRSAAKEKYATFRKLKKCFISLANEVRKNADVSTPTREREPQPFRVFPDDKEFAESYKLPADFMVEGVKNFVADMTKEAAAGDKPGFIPWHQAHISVDRESHTITIDRSRFWDGRPAPIPPKE
jgi:hypothetical protein